MWLALSFILLIASFAINWYFFGINHHVLDSPNIESKLNNNPSQSSSVKKTESVPSYEKNLLNDSLNINTLRAKDICSIFKSCESLQTTQLTFEITLKVYLKYLVPVNIPSNISNVNQWQAMKWNLRDWASGRWPVLNDVLELSTEKSFGVLLTPDDSMGEMELSSEFTSYKIQNEVMLFDFINDYKYHKKKNVCRFYSTNYRVLEGLAELDNDTNWKALRIKEVEGEYDNLTPIYSLMTAPCALQFRYQEYHNLRVQLTGKANYYVVSPDHIADLLPFPSLHPAKGQSQINFYLENEDPALANKLKNISIWKTTLTKGDSLLIPPGYFLLSETEKMSSMIDILSVSKDHYQFLEALYTPLPFLKQKNMTLDERLVYTQVYLVHLLSRIEGLSSIRQYSRALYRSRYGRIYPKDSMYFQSQDFQCFKGNESYHSSVVKKMNKEQIEKLADFVAKKLNNKKISNGLKWLWIGNYIEDKIKQSWGKSASLGKIALFLLECLDLRGKIDVIEEVLGPSTVTLDPQ